MNGSRVARTFRRRNGHVVRLGRPHARKIILADAGADKLEKDGNRTKVSNPENVVQKLNTSSE